ncbi:hypothetical protein V2I01_15320 [Micromonospora sp. BRA006-A]|nr:hypothetical protein [Micromonospora sp. BRA006-A]
MASWHRHGLKAKAAVVPAVALVALLGLVVQSEGIDTTAELVALLVVLASSAALYLRRRHRWRWAWPRWPRSPRTALCCTGPGRSCWCSSWRCTRSSTRVPRGRGGARRGLCRLVRRRRQLHPDRCQRERGDAAARRLARRGHRRRHP